MKAIVRFFNSFCRPAAVILIVCGSSFVSGCSDAGDILDLALNPLERKEIDTSIMGVNNFFVDREFGSIPEQFTEIRDTLGLPRVRILLAWLTDVQPSPAVAPNYGFFDEIIGSIPAGVEVLVVLAHSPDWITDPNNWVNGNPRRTWIDHWLIPTVTRYANVPGIVGFEIWNEPNETVLVSDVALGLEATGLHGGFHEFV
ncbi:MAG TPA: cellulase family glycosylhydrolase, partial [Oligoflexia bacterium]|nr:cellulase family glycosylhydrolase [Oligoflexia bacterium]